MSSATVIASQRTGAFVRDGYAVLERFFDDDDVHLLRADVEQVLLSPQERSCERPHNMLVPLRWSDSLVARVLGAEMRRNRLRDVVDSEDLRWISGYLSVKEPTSPALWWHQDWWCWDHPVSYRPEAPQIAVLCYLTPTDDRSGALRVLPGSHHASTSLHAFLPEAHNLDEADLSVTHPAMADHPDQVTLALAAGDAVVIDYRLLHGTHANATRARRDCMLLTFAPSWSALPADVRGHLIRHPALPIDGEHPPTASWARYLLPHYGGPRRDLPLNRVTPQHFAVGDQ